MTERSEQLSDHTETTWVVQAKVLESDRVFGFDDEWVTVHHVPEFVQYHKGAVVEHYLSWTADYPDREFRLHQKRVTTTYTAFYPGAEQTDDEPGADDLTIHLENASDISGPVCDERPPWVCTTNILSVNCRKCLALVPAETVQSVLRPETLRNRMEKT